MIDWLIDIFNVLKARFLYHATCTYNNIVVLLFLWIYVYILEINTLYYYRILHVGLSVNFHGDHMYHSTWNPYTAFLSSPELSLKLWLQSLRLCCLATLSILMVTLSHISAPLIHKEVIQATKYCTVDYDRICKVHTSSKQLNFSFAYSAPRLWNGLPLELRLSDSLSTFRKKVITHLFASIHPP